MQERGEKRVAGLLEAAAAIFAEVDPRRRRCAISRSVPGSIGSLYQFFPSKDVVARELKTQYCQELKELWARLVVVSAKTTTSRLVDQLLNVTIRAIEKHPAIIRLMDAPRDSSRSRYQGIASTTARRIVSYAEAADIPDQGASPCGNYRPDGEGVVQMVRALLWLYVETEPPEREALVAEMKSALVNYLSPRLE
jgi:hypothetical protein